MVWHPGATEAEKRSGGGLLAVLNELGRDGWQLTTSTALDSTIAAGTRHGWDDCAFRIRQRYIMMRELPT